MKTWFGWAAASLVVVSLISFAWIQRQRVATPAALSEVDAQTKYTEQEQAKQMVDVNGPLANYMLREKRADVETLQPLASHKPAGSDHVGNSPVGTSTALLNKTFSVANVVQLPFDLPAHASSAQLHGTYRSFVAHAGGQPAGEPAGDASGLVEFLVLNQQQYDGFLSGRPADALFSADSAPAQEVNFTMPPTFAQSAKYHLIFRNSSRTTGKKVVQADFRIDF